MSDALGSQRESFEIPRDITYLNCAYMGPLSHRVADAIRTGSDRKLQPWTIGVDDFFGVVEDARELFAQLIGGDADGVALTPSVSYGIALAAQLLEPRAKGRIVTLADEFPSNVYAWRDLAVRTGADLVTVPRPTDGDWTAALLHNIDERTSIVATPQCHWTDGGLVDLIRISDSARRVGAALVVDGIQSIGAMPMMVNAIEPDFVACASYKWLLGPYSAGFVWCAPQHRDGRPLEFNWKNRARSDDFQNLVSYRDDYRAGARRYDVGEVSNFALMPGVVAALRQTLDWGVDAVAARIRGLTARVAVEAEALGLSVAPEDRRAGHLIGVRLHGSTPEAVARAMADADVFVSVRGDAMRVAPHVYNDDDDIARLFEVLRSTL